MPQQTPQAPAAASVPQAPSWTTKIPNIQAFESDNGAQTGNGGKYPGMPGAFTGTMAQVQNDMESGKLPGVFKPMASIGPSDATPGTAGQSQGQAPVVLLATDTKGYAALPPGAQYTVNGNAFTKQGQAPVTSGTTTAGVTWKLTP